MQFSFVFVRDLCKNPDCDQSFCFRVAFCELWLLSLLFLFWFLSQREREKERERERVLQLFCFLFLLQILGLL